MRGTLMQRPGARAMAAWCPALGAFVLAAGEAWAQAAAPVSEASRWTGTGQAWIVAGVLAALVFAVLLVRFGVSLRRGRRLAAALAEARDAREVYATLFEDSQAVKLLVDPADGGIVRANAAAVRFYGYPPETLERMHIWDISLTDPRQILDAMQCDEGDGVRRSRLRHRLADGEVRDVEVASSAVTIHGRRLLYAIIQDITERLATRRERDRLAAAVEHASDAVCVTDTEGVIRYVNPAFCSISGYAREELLGATPRLLKSGRQDEGFYRGLWETIRSGRLWSGRLTNRRKDGGRFLVDMTISPIRGEHGSVAHFVAIMRDVTGQAALEAKLRQTQKMEAVGTLAGGIAHDFNNILMSVMGFSDLALRNLDDPAKAEAFLGYIRGASRRGADLVQQLLAFSRTGESEMQRLSPAPVVRQALHLVAAGLPADVGLVREVDEDTPPVLGDAAGLHQVVVNLCTNAVHAMESGGGELRVRLFGEADDSAVGPAGGARVVLEVADTGHGMNEAVVERACEPFFTTRGQGKGTGLGLSVVHGIVKDHGGEMRIRSVPDRGTVVRIVLPTLAGEAPEATGAAPRGSARVGFVDDREDICTLMDAGLRAAGFEVTAGPDPARVLEALRHDPQSLDVLVTDLAMPGMDGMAVAEAVRRLAPDVPVVLCAGRGDDLGGFDPEDSNIVECLRKPFTDAELVRTVQGVLDRRS